MSVSERKRQGGKSYIILGHSCVKPEEDDYIIPDDVIYITTGICGLKTRSIGLNGELINRFFANDPFFEREDPHDILWLDPNIEHSPKHRTTGDNTYIVVNQPTESVIFTKYAFLLKTVLDETSHIVWNAYKSGVYPFNNHLKRYADVTNSVAVSISISSDELNPPQISIAQIKTIFSDAIYPKVTDIIFLINQIRNNHGEPQIRQDTDLCLLDDFEYAVNTLSIELPELVNMCKSHSKGNIRIFDPLCKHNCSRLSATDDVSHKRKEQRNRRRKQENSMAKHFVPDGILGGKSRKRKHKIVRKKKTRRL